MRKFAALAMAILVGGCRLLLDVDTPQCEQDRDCVGLLGDGYTCSEWGVCEASDAEATNSGLPDRYACLDEPLPVPDDVPTTITIGIKIADYLSPDTTPEGVLVNACTKRDVNCDTPIATDVPTNNDGAAMVDVPGGFDGYFEVTAPGYVPGIFSINHPVYEDVTLPGPSLFTPAVLQAIASMGDATLAQGTGIVIADFVDCDGQAAPGVAVKTVGDPEYQVFYISGSFPDYALEGTHISDEVGADGIPRAVAGVHSVAKGFLSMQATLNDPETPFAEFTVGVRSDTMSFVRVYAGEVK